MKQSITRFAGLGYRNDAPNLWRFVDLSTDKSIGPAYPTRAELLADVDRFGSEVWDTSGAPASPGLLDIPPLEPMRFYGPEIAGRVIAYLARFNTPEAMNRASYDPKVRAVIEADAGGTGVSYPLAAYLDSSGNVVNVVRQYGRGRRDRAVKRKSE